MMSFNWVPPSFWTVNEIEKHKKNVMKIYIFYILQTRRLIRPFDNHIHVSLYDSSED